MCDPVVCGRAAVRRSVAAFDIFRKTEHHLEAMYLGGYAVECALKALILRRTPRKSWPAVCQEITQGTLGHDLRRLALILRRRGWNPDSGLEASLRYVQEQWSVNLRYQSHRPGAGIVKQFMLEMADLVKKFGELR
jgi:hypothetical protein